ncbi:hypothetical protein N783_18400 [Pontibacillus marinus BH030004 = DSM 16465]|uniref:VWFA domain-containing protein n=2 Tax=Pontibacillus TaxID=289201 RepID=A0A0A5I4N3_9BACI|nr:hypothetical protein N783_18400 [Pontibacillus marinus BH030004 = DSM 16465]
MVFQVDNPLWLLTFIPMVLVLFLYARGLTAISGGRKMILMVLRTLVFTLVILALAGVQILSPIQHMATAFVVDRSHSMQDHENGALEQVQEAVDGKAPEDEVGVISTGAKAQVEIPLTNSDDAVQSFQTDINTSYTNLGASLQLGGSLFSGDAKGRVVLMTDGNENVGDAVRQAGYLKRQGYVVDVFPYSTTFQQDIAIDSFDVPENIYLGEQASLSLSIQSSIDTTSTVRVQQNGELILDQEVNLNAGMNQLSFEHLVTEDGFHTFQAEIVAEGDQVLENNKLSAFAETKGIPRVLIVEGKDGAAVNLEESLNSSAVQADRIPVELLPTQLSNFLQYDSIVMSNVSAHTMTESQMNLIHKAVKDFGVGFVMTGGEQSYGVGGYFKTPIERLLPVDMDIKGKKELPSLGLAIVLDKSGSMGGNKMALAREAAVRSIELLREKDTLGVIAFDSTPWQIVETGPIGDKEDVIKKVRSIMPSGGTDIFTPTAQAFSQLGPMELKRKHIILLTDGQSAASMNYRQMIQNGKEDGVTLSTVAIGTGADGPLLDEMAQIGDGRFYQVQNATKIPTILSRETALITRTYIEDDPFYPKLVRGYEWAPYFANGVPRMNAYIATSPKGRAQQVLVSEKNDPVLSRWQYGLGKTVAWTSDLTGKWAGEWPSWGNWSPLWNDIVTWTFPQYENDAYEITKQVEGNEVTLNVKAADEGASTLEGSLVNEAGEEVDLNLQAKAPGVYEGTFQTDGAGVYFLNLTEQEDGEPVGTFKTGVVVPYSEEYSFEPTNEKLIGDIAEAGGGKVLENMNDVFSTRGLGPRYEKQDLFYFLLALALILFMLDVAIRRFHVNLAFIGKLRTSSEKKKKKEKQVTEKRSTQLSQLKSASTKRTQGSSSDENKKEKQPIIQETPDSKQKPPKKEKQNESSGGESREERMNRLLNAKKRK